VVPVHFGKARVEGSLPVQCPRCASRAAGYEDPSGRATGGWMGVQPGIGRETISLEIPRPPLQDQRAVARQLPEPLLAGRAALDVHDERAELVPVQLLLEEPREHAVARAGYHSGPPASPPLLRPASALRSGGRIAASDLRTPSDSPMTPRSWRRLRDGW